MVKDSILLEIASSSGNDTMLRQVTEAVTIKELNPELNTKEEWGNSNALRERKVTFAAINHSNLNQTNIRRMQR